MSGKVVPPTSVPCWVCPGWSEAKDSVSEGHVYKSCRCEATGQAVESLENSNGHSALSRPETTEKLSMLGRRYCEPPALPEIPVLDKNLERGGMSMIHGETTARNSTVAPNSKDKAKAGEQCDWKRAHTELVRLAADQARLDWEVGSWLLQAVRSGTPLRLGYGSIAEYAHRLFGYEAALHQRTAARCRSARRASRAQPRAA